MVLTLAKLIEAEPGRMNPSLNNVAAMDTITSVTACVVNELGGSIVPRIAALDGSALIVAPFGDPPVPRQIGLLQRPQNRRSALVEELHSHLAAASGDYRVPDYR
ncbi:LysR substrate-binding domain-containing protein [Sinorhizobium sp. RAC02]|uniref:LysR substrate-binding domain-containing protein n=1 Tax=Sinorhizobium sp. RAC02 TaxID=1842534 RepID=UPI00083DA6CC|nr:LysR substrate-binding domain-containing protein [Sinorhizobium sp. RAC02]AOF93660.1 lysR substrate binding domain protein [Sinorhizobium sp. RAC02]